LLRPPNGLYAFQVFVEARTAIFARGRAGATTSGNEKNAPDSAYAWK
jgi:hypothetical protein